MDFKGKSLAEILEESKKSLEAKKNETEEEIKDETPVENVLEEEVKITPLQRAYKELETIQAGRLLQDIPHNDPYYTKREEIHRMEDK